MNNHLGADVEPFVEQAKKQVRALYPSAKADVFEESFKEVIDQALEKASRLESPAEQTLFFQQEINGAVTAALQASRSSALRTIH